jgi:alpha-1,3-glucan synthase
MLSQLTKTIKMALKSTEEERAVLRARSALQRFPVVEWRQRMEDLHKRSIITSRGLAGSNAWRESDCDNGVLPTMADTDDWNPTTQTYPTHPEWDIRSVSDSPQLNPPGSPGSPGQWSPDMLTPGDGAHMLTPGDGARLVSETQRSLHSGDGDTYFTPRGGMAEGTPDGFNTFLERANRTISKDQAHATDPFADGGLAPSRPFSNPHNRLSSVESIASIVEEKSDSPLNRAVTTVGYL